MKIIFLSIGDVSSLHMSEHGVYTDMMRCLNRNGHDVYVATCSERRNRQKTRLDNECGIHVLRVQTGNITKCSFVEKGISTQLIEFQFIGAIKKYFNNIKFDLILYSTPPITFSNVVRYIKKRDHAKTYLMLKDIFPQNAVDLGMMTTSGPKSIIYKHFRHMEVQLYAISDKIGCMSQANVDYVLSHNPEINTNKVEICPNSIEIQNIFLSDAEKLEMRNKYGIPKNKIVFVYGGNLGRPQGIPFIIECLKTQEQNPNAFFLIVGDGTEYRKLERYFAEIKPENMKLMKHLPKDDYDRMIAACDIGMIFLDHRFTIPNFPSRLLSYMQAGLPVLACTDTNTDIGRVITEGGFGWDCESNNKDEFNSAVLEALETIGNSEKRKNMIKNETKYLIKHYNVEQLYSKIEVL